MHPVEAADRSASGRAVGLMLVRACFDGIYPVALPEDDLIGKYLLEPGVANPGLEVIQ